MLKIFRLRYTFIKSCFNFALVSFIIFDSCIHESVHVQGRRIYGWGNNINTVYRPVISSQGFQPMTQQTKAYGGGNGFGYFGNSGTSSNGWRNNGYSNNWFGNGFLASPNYYYRPPQQNSHYYGTPSYNDYQGSVIDVNKPPIKNVPVEVKPIPNHAIVEKGPVITSPVVTTIPQESISKEDPVAVPGKDKQTVDVPEYNIEIPAEPGENKKTENPEEISTTEAIENHKTEPKGQDDIKVDDGSQTSMRIPEEAGESENGNNPSTKSNNQKDIQGQTNTPQTTESAENPNQSSNDNVNDGNESAYTNQQTEPPVRADNISNEDDSLISNFAQNNANGNISNEDDSLISNFAQNNADGNISNEDDSLISNFAQNNANGDISNEGDSIISNAFYNSTEDKNSSGVDESVTTGENQGVQEHEQSNTSGEIPNTNNNVSNEDEGVIASFLTNPTTDNNFNGGGNPNEPSAVETVGNNMEEETEEQSLPDYTDIFDVRLNINNNEESRTNERRIDDNVCGIPGVTPDMATVDKTSLLPWLVTLGTGNSFDFHFLCGGTIISKSIVLSSAHCFHQELPTIAKIGDLYLPIEKIKIHERYNISQAYNNIALIKLASPVNTSTLEACLPNHNSSTPHDGSGMDSSVLEWKVAKTGDLAKPEISISKILPNSHCIKAYENVDNVANYFPRGFDSTLLCVKQQQKSTYCRGDSGVQLYHVNTDNIFTLIGTISDPEDSCGENKFPAVFTKVSSYASWIFDNALILSQ